MDINSTEELLELLSSITDYLTAHEDELYVALEVSYQLRDEIVQAISTDSTD